MNQSIPAWVIVVAFPVAFIVADMLMFGKGGNVCMWFRSRHR